MRPLRPVPLDTLKSVLRPVVQPVIDHMLGMAFGPREVDLCEFAEVLEFSLDLRRKNHELSSILLKRERCDDRWSITQVVLDSQDRLIRSRKKPLGRVVIAKAMDDELRDLFGDAESIVVELPPPSVEASQPSVRP